MQICQKRMPRCEELADLIVDVAEYSNAEALSEAILRKLEERNVFDL